MNKYNVFDDILEGAQVIGPDYTYLYVNKAVAAHAKVSIDFLLGKKMFEAFPGIEQTEIFKLIGKCLNESEVFELINEYDHPDGEKGWFQLKVQPVTEGALVLSHDITSVKRAELVLTQYNAQLEEEVKERTKKIQDQKEIIDEQNETLKLSNQKLSEFTSLVSHDLKAPLRNIKILLSFLIEDGGIKDGFDDDVNKILDASNKMEGMITDLLTFSKVDHLEKPVNFVPLRELLESCKSNFEEKKLAYTCDNCPEVKLDIVWTQAAFNNLIGNGFKYNKSPEPEVKIEYNPKTKELSFKDNGIGIDEKNFSKVFTPLSRFESGYEGTGLGLSITKKILDSQSTPIRFESTVGQGTTFYIDLTQALKK